MLGDLGWLFQLHCIAGLWGWFTELVSHGTSVNTQATAVTIGVLQERCTQAISGGQGRLEEATRVGLGL